MGLGFCRFQGEDLGAASEPARGEGIRWWRAAPLRVYGTQESEQSSGKISSAGRYGNPDKAIQPLEVLSSPDGGREARDVQLACRILRNILA